MKCRFFRVEKKEDDTNPQEFIMDYLSEFITPKLVFIEYHETIPNLLERYKINYERKDDLIGNYTVGCSNI